VLVGAGASSITQSTLEGLSALGIPSCTPSATSGDLSTLRTATKLFRTVPSDEFVVGIIAGEIVNDNNAEKVVILARADAYGNFMAEQLGPALEGAGVAADAVVTINYDPASQDLSAEAGQVAAENPTAVIIVGFDEAGPLIRNLIEDPNGMDPNTFYGADGVFSSQLADLAGISIDGMKVIGAAGSTEFNQRLSDEGTPDFIYGGQAYDCTILLALWAALEDTDDSSQWDPANLAGLTQDGEVCTTFADCLALIEAGTDIDYDGVSGPLNLAPGNPGGEGTAGEPTISTYAVAQWQGGELTPVSSTEVDLTS
jgi:branched-chain amino acid transport system substrate-binding protein